VLAALVSHGRPLGTLTVASDHVTVAAVKSSLHRARLQLREKLSKMFQQGDNRIGGNGSFVFGEV